MSCATVLLRGKFLYDLRKCRPLEQLRRQDFQRVIDCLPGTYSAENPKKYEPIKVGFLIRKFEWPAFLYYIQALDYILLRNTASYAAQDDD